MTETLPDKGGYVVAAYLVFLLVLLVYIGIMALRISRLERELVKMHEIVDAQREDRAAAPAAATPVVAPEPSEVGS